MQGSWENKNGAFQETLRKAASGRAIHAVLPDKRSQFLYFVFGIFGRGPLERDKDVVWDQVNYKVTIYYPYEFENNRKFDVHKCS